jgi:hypothetical protein
MRRKKITQEEFEKVFWFWSLHNDSVVQWSLCFVFRCLGVAPEFEKFWDEVNTKPWIHAGTYMHKGASEEEIAMFRLMIAQEFIKQYNEGLR